MSSITSSTSASTSPNHLIIVCCHAIYTGGSAEDESNWLIEPFQRGETATYIAHIEAGVRELSRDKEHAILVFSGGATKRDRTDRSEGEGYLAVATEKNLFNLDTTPPSLRQRIFVDRYATDSYQNILLSLVQWPLFVRRLELISSDSTSTSSKLPLPSEQSTCGGGGGEMPMPAWPTKLTIVSHEFKRARFLELHLPAIAWNREETVFVGIDPPFDKTRMAEIEEGDRLRGYGAWKGDLYGVGEGPRGKRAKRGWDGDAFRREVLERLGGVGVSLSVREELERVVFWGGGGEGRLLMERVNVPWA
ncbi:hypothetical protein H2202_007862 [Exophiala xenobiotica]|nr:hypothetical protein H2202_007862 [Exophiala xenobiotica]